MKDPARFWVGTALEVYGFAYSPRLLKRLGVPAPVEWDDVLTPKLKGQIVQCTPTRSSSSHATYQIILQTKGEREGWEWLKRLAAIPELRHVQPGGAGSSSPERSGRRLRRALVLCLRREARRLRHQIRGPQERLRDTGAVRDSPGAKHPQAARQFLHFLLSERGQRLFMGRGLFPVTPKYKVHGPPGSTEELAVQLTGGIRSFFDAPVSNIYDDALARSRYREVNDKFRSDIEAVWGDLKKRY